MGDLRSLQRGNVWQGTTKKLTDAVAHLFSNGGKADLEQDYDLLGTPPPEVVAAITTADTFEIWLENLESLSVFMGLLTQWTYGPRGVVGLNYAGVQASLTMSGVECTPRLFADIQAMETAALKKMRE